MLPFVKRVHLLADSLGKMDTHLTQGSCCRKGWRAEKIYAKTFFFSKKFIVWCPGWRCRLGLGWFGLTDTQQDGGNVLASLLLNKGSSVQWIHTWHRLQQGIALGLVLFGWVGVVFIFLQYKILEWETNPKEQEQPLCVFNIWRGLKLLFSSLLVHSKSQWRHLALLQLDEYAKNTVIIT